MRLVVKSQPRWILAAGVILLTLRLVAGLPMPVNVFLAGVFFGMAALMITVDSQEK